MQNLLNHNGKQATIEIKTSIDSEGKDITEELPWDQLTDSNKQDIASQWIEDHVYCNVNQVMELLAQNDDHCDFDEYQSIAEYQDFEYVSTDHINDLSIDELIELQDDYDFDICILEENLNKALIDINEDELAPFIIDSIDLDQYGKDNDLEPEYQQAYEFWSVSDHFVAMINDSTSKDILGLSVWARYCTGQAICLDHQIQVAAFKALSDCRFDLY